MATGGVHTGDGPRPDALVGRAAELDALCDALARCRAGEPGLVLVEGEPGTGKSALVRALLDRREPADRLLLASGEEAEQRLDYGIVEQLHHEAVALGLRERLPFGRAGSRPDPLEVGAGIVSLVAASAGSPVLVVVDDAQWADAQSVQAITFAIRRLRSVPLLAVLVHRPHAPLLEPLQRRCADGQGLRLRLGPLDAPTLRELVRVRFGTTLSPRAAARLHEHTRGNPLEVLTVVEELGTNEVATGLGPLPAPRSYATLVLNRLAAGPPAVERLVAAVAVLGAPVPVGALGRMVDEPDAAAGIDDAIARGLLLATSRAGTTVVDVAHPLLRAAVLQDLAPGRRADLHRRAAAITPDPTRAMRHRLAATLDHDPPLAREAVALARERGAAGWELSAVDLLTAAARTFPDGPERTGALLDAAERLLATGDLPSAREVLDEVGPATGDPREHLVRGHAAFLGGDPRAARDALRRAWEAGDDAVASRAAGLMATISANAGRGDRSLEWARRALARATPDRPDAGHAVSMLASAWALEGDLAAGIVEVESWRHKLAGTPGEVDALLGRGLLALWTNDLATAEHLLGRVLDLGDDTSPLTTATARYSMADAAYRKGDWDRALALSTALARDLDDGDQPLPAPMAHGVAASVLAGRGLVPQARVHLAAGRRAIEAAGNPAGGMWLATASARLAAAQADHAGVVASLQPIAELLDGSAMGEVVPWRTLLVEALVALDRLDEAAGALDALARRDVHGPHALAGAARARGLLAAAQGEDEAAATAFDEGLALDPADTGAFVRARLELAAGGFHRRRGRRRLGAELLTAARDRFDGLGAAPFVAIARRELDACGLAPRGRGGGDLAALTRSEAAVARLVARGLTNREVATELVVSVKTVESHLAKVFTKLGVRSRTELAARGAVDEDRHPDAP